MQVLITAVGPDNRGLADPIIHYVTSFGANIAEIQMYDHDAEHLIAMLLRMDWPVDVQSVPELRAAMKGIGDEKGLSIRIWSSDEKGTPPRLALCVTYRPDSFRRQRAGSSRAGGSSTCTTDCCRRFPARSRTAMPTAIACSRMAPPFISSCRNSMRGIKLFTRTRSR